MYSLLLCLSLPTMHLILPMCMPNYAKEKVKNLPKRLEEGSLLTVQASKPVQAGSAHLVFIPGYIGNTMNRNRLDLIVPWNRETIVIFKIGVHVAKQLREFRGG